MLSVSAIAACRDVRPQLRVRAPAPSASVRRLLRASRQFPAGTDVVAGVAVRITLEVVLVLGLRLPERSSRLHLGHDLAGPKAGGLDVGDRVLRDPPLLIIDVVDRRAVAHADVVALTVLCV